MKQTEFRPYRCDAISKVTGRARYSGDIHMEGMLCIKAVRLPVPAARVLRVDVKDAEQAPGVERVVTFRDLSGPNQAGVIGRNTFAQPILIGEGACTGNLGDAVALVAAQTDDDAARAAKLVHVEYEEIPAFHTWQEAAAAQAKPAVSHQISHGDPAAGFARSALILERSYHTPLAEHAYMEPEAGAAWVDENGRLNIRVGTQAVRQQASMICQALGLPFNKVRIFTPYVGGGFGGKHSMTVHVWLGLCALLTGRPVRMVWTREESVCFSCKKQSFDANVKIGFDIEGHITAMQADINGPTSPYTGKSFGRLANYMKYMLGPYRQPNVDLRGRMYNTTSMEIGAFRGVAGPDGCFVIETLMDQGAAGLGISPREIRRRNWLRNEEEIGNQFRGCTARLFTNQFLMPEILDLALKEAGEPPKAPGKRAGRGIACGTPGYAAYSSDTQCSAKAGLTLNLDGTFTVRTGFPELGQGIVGVAEAIMAEEFGAEPEELTVMLSDADQIPINGELGFSAATVNGGAALVDACTKMKTAILRTASECLNCDPSKLTFSYREKCFRDSSGEVVLDWEEFKKHLYLRMELTVIGETDTRPELRNQYGITPIACVADVAVDEETGEITVLQMLQCEDVGKVIHYESARGQLIGATVMAMGTTLMEEYLMKDGKPVTPSFAEYLIPTAKDIPRKNRAIMVETNPATVGPYGAKGIGEHGMFAANAAIANAIRNALGVSITTMPITAETVLRAMGKVV